MVENYILGHVYYKIHDGTHNIAQARNLCEQDASFLTLPMPRNEEQNDFYYNLVGGKQEHDMWLDFSDELQEGKWVDAHGEPVTWFKWWSHEPNNAYSGGSLGVGQGEHWIEMDLSGRHGYSDAGLKYWNDIWFTVELGGGFHCGQGRKRRDSNEERLDCKNDNIAVCTFVVPKNSDICKF